MPRKAHKYHYIYKITCNVTEKFYVGMHSCSDLEDGYMGSGKKLGRSLNKYGIENHTKQILEFLPDRKSLAEREREIVNQEMLNEDLCMNLQLGGGGGFSSEEHLLNFRKGASINMKANWNNPIFIDKHKERSSVNMKQTHREGKIKYDTFTGKFHTEESKQLMRDKAKERIGDKNSQFGTCWINNGLTNKKIRKGDSIPNDWKLGRIKIL